MTLNPLELLPIPAVLAALGLLTCMALLILGDGPATEEAGADSPPASHTPLATAFVVLPEIEADPEPAAEPQGIDPLDPNVPLSQVEELATRLEAMRATTGYTAMWSWSGHTDEGTRELATV